MKTTKSIIAVLFVLLTAQMASAFYCPSTGRWLSRDPMGEPGFEVLQAGTQITTSSRRWIKRDPLMELGEKNPYESCFNNAANVYDPDGRNPIVIVIGGVTVTVGECAVVAVTTCMASPPCRDALIALIKTGVRTIGDTIGNCCRPKKCLPCNPPVGTVAYRVDMPPSPPHNGIPTPHSHPYQMNQSPPEAGCKCFWVETQKDPIPGILGPPITPASGGGIAP